MSELHEAAQAALTAYETFRDVDDIDGLDDAMDRLRAALAQHVEEAIAREREACAKACEDVATTQWDEYAASYNSAVFDCAAAIRARAEKEME